MEHIDWRPVLAACGTAAAAGLVVAILQRRRAAQHPDSHRPRPRALAADGVLVLPLTGVLLWFLGEELRTGAVSETVAALPAHVHLQGIGSVMLTLGVGLWLGQRAADEVDYWQAQRASPERPSA